MRFSDDVLRAVLEMMGWQPRTRGREHYWIDPEGRWYNEWFALHRLRRDLAHAASVEPDHPDGHAEGAS
jgi:hypothetical protein